MTTLTTHAGAPVIGLGIGLGIGLAVLVIVGLAVRKARAERRKGVAMPGLATMIRGAMREAREEKRQGGPRRKRRPTHGGTDIHYSDFGGDSDVGGS